MKCIYLSFSWTDLRKWLSCCLLAACCSQILVSIDQGGYCRVLLPTLYGVIVFVVDTFAVARIYECNTALLIFVIYCVVFSGIIFCYTVLFSSMCICCFQFIINLHAVVASFAFLAV